MSSRTQTAPPRAESPTVSGKIGLTKVLIGSFAALGLVIALVVGVIAFYATGQADDLGNPGPVSSPNVFSQ